ncbi:MAG: hypothetical protein JWR77_1603, partial [Rhizorhabdus sp.]|nr:hypothetical protein [Rhizorhabdus sp.]
ERLSVNDKLNGSATAFEMGQTGW